MKKITVIKYKDITAPGYLGDKPVAQIGLVLSDGQGTTIFTEICCLIDNEFNSKKIELAEAFADECVARFDDSKNHNMVDKQKCDYGSKESDAKWLSGYLLNEYPHGVKRNVLLLNFPYASRRSVWNMVIDYALDHGIIEYRNMCACIDNKKSYVRLLFGVKE